MRTTSSGAPLRGTAMQRPGRPRDPGLEARVFDAAMALYAAVGWESFNFDRVAAAANVGKAALYRRWKTRGALLRATLDARWYHVGAIDTGSLREDLILLASRWFDMLVGPNGDASLQLLLDTKRHREVLACAGKYEETLVLQCRAVARRAVLRGELPAHMNPGLIVDAIIGAVMIHVNATPRRLRAAMLKQSGNFIATLVDVIMQGTGGVPARGARRRAKPKPAR